MKIIEKYLQELTMPNGYEPRRDDIMQCTVCGRKADVLNEGQGTLVCCGKAMIKVGEAIDRFERGEESMAESKNKNENKPLNKPFRLPSGSNKKFGVYVKNDKGNVVMVKFGDPNMEIKRDDPERLKSFRARHGCDNPGPKWKARYWSCKFWEKGISVTDLLKGKGVSENKSPCWKGYEMVGWKMKDGKKVPNCVPIKEAEGMEGLPKGWTQKSLQKFTKSLTGKEGTKKGFFDKCVEKMKGKVSDPEAFCASAKDELHGSTYWRNKPPEEAKKAAKQKQNVKQD